MAKIPRKSLSDSVKRDLEQRNKKEELADQVIAKLSESDENKEPKRKREEQSKLTVMIPVDLHEKLKFKALEKKSKIRNLIIEYIKEL